MQDCSGIGGVLSPCSTVLQQSKTQLCIDSCSLQEYLLFTKRASFCDLWYVVLMHPHASMKSWIWISLQIPETIQSTDPKAVQSGNQLTSTVSVWEIIDCIFFAAPFIGSRMVSVSVSKASEVVYYTGQNQQQILCNMIDRIVHYHSLKQNGVPTYRGCSYKLLSRAPTSPMLLCPRSSLW